MVAVLSEERPPPSLCSDGMYQSAPAAETKHHGPGLNHRTSVFSQFWRLDFQDQGAGLCGVNDEDGRGLTLTSPSSLRP